MDPFNGYVSLGVGFVTILGALIGWGRSILEQREKSVMSAIHSARAEDKLAIQGMLNDHQEKTRSWINGSFMRATEVETKYESLCERMDRFEDRLDKVR